MRSTLQVPLLVLVRGIVTVICTGIVAAFGWQTWTGRETVAADSRRVAANLAESLSQQSRSSFEAADSVVASLQYWAESPLLGANRARALQASMDARFHALPQLHALYLIGPHGEPLIASVARGRPARSVYDDREYFRYHATHASRSAFIGEPIRSRTDGEWVVTVSRRLDNPDGSFRGVVVATVALSTFRDLYDRLNLGPRALIVLIRLDGTIEVRRPFVQRFIGSNVANGSVFAHLRRSPSDVFVMPAVTDGIVRLTAYRRLDGFPLVLVVGLPVDELYADWYRATSFSGIATFAILAVIVLLARRLTAEVRLREGSRAQLESYAFLDGLTELANRRRFDAALQEEWRRAARDGTSLCVLMADADLFKSYNDRYGHLMGDHVLRVIADCIRVHAKRPGDLATRYGGEEFAVLLPATALEGGLVIAEAIRAEMLDLRIPHDDNPAGVATLSIGVAAMVPANGAYPADLVTAADAALYAAKRAGRNRVSSTAVAAERGR